MPGFVYGIAFDGANIWVSNSESNSVSKLRASDGSIVGTYSVGANPLELAFDGTNIWVANNGATPSASCGPAMEQPLGDPTVSG